MKESKENFKKVFSQFGLKNTEPRKAVLKIFLETAKPLTAPEMYKKIKKDNLDLVTLYRTLASFEERGLIRRVNLRQDAVFYELNKNHHHHIVCLQCGRIEDFENKEIEKVLEKVVKKSSQFKNVKEHSLEIFGICRSCE